MFPILSDLGSTCKLEVRHKFSSVSKVCEVTKNRDFNMSLPETYIHKLSSSEPALNRIIEADASNFRNKFNLAPFIFTHNLAGHPLFEIPRLIELTNTLLIKGGRDKALCRTSNSSTHMKWGEMPHKEQVTEAIAHIKESGSLVFLKSVQLDKEYANLLDKCIIEFEDLTGVPLQKEITWSTATIIISSPHSITPYHIDHEANFLFQICGRKDVYLFDPQDRSVLTEQELEHYYIGDFESVNYKEESQSKANTYHLIPGKGVHQPSQAPHWVKNGNSVSISLSINFCLHSIDLPIRVYQVNHYLRQLGLEPTPPGKSPLKDNFKIFAIGMLSKRNSEDHDEVICSGVRKLKALLAPVRQVATRLKR